MAQLAAVSMPDIDVQRLLVRLEARIDKYEQNLARANSQTDKRARAIEARFDQSVRRLDDAGRRMGEVYDPMLAASRRAEAAIGASSGRIKTALLGSASSLATGLAAGFTVNKVKEYADGYTRYTNELKVAGLEGEKLTAVQDRLFASAQRYGAPLEQLGTLYGKIAVVQGELGASSEDLLRFSNGTAAALKVQGGSADSARGALLQLTQGLGSTIFRAEEFNSVMEGARPILQAVASGSDRWGGSVSKLRQDVIAGNVTNKDFFQAALIGFRQTEKQAERATLTIGASLQILNNALGKYVGETDASLSATQRLSAGIQGVASNLDLIVPALGVVAAAYGVKVVGGVAAANKAELELALAVARGTAEYIDGANTAKIKARVAAAAAETEVTAIQATVAALREEAAQYQANIALAERQRLEAKAAQAQAAANAAAGLGRVKVGAGGLSAPLNGATAATSFAEAGKNAVADRQRLAQATKELQAAEGALEVAVARSTAAELARKTATDAARLSTRLATAATELFTGALTLIGGSAVGGAVVLAIGAIVAAIVLHNRHVKQAAEDQAALRENTKSLSEKLKETASYGRAAAEGVKGLGAQASTSTPKVTAFAGAVGQLADELYRAAEARRAEAVAALEAQRSKAKVDLDKAVARQAEETRPVRNSALEEGGRGAVGGAATVGLNQLSALANSNAAQEVAQAQANYKAADSEIARLKALNLAAFVKPSDLTGKRDLPAEMRDLQQRLKIAQAAHNSVAIRELQAQVYTLKKTGEYMKAGLKFEDANAKASAEAAQIRDAAAGYDAQKAGAKASRQELRDQRADLQHDRRYAADLTRAQDEQLQAQADLSLSTQDRLAVELSRIENARQARAAELAEMAKSPANPSGYSAAEIANLTRLANDTAEKQRRRAQAQAEQEVADQVLSVAQAEADGRAELLQAQVNLADTVAERRSLELRILDIQYDEERARLEAVVASKASTDAEKLIAAKRLAILPTLQAQAMRAVERQNETQLAAYRRSLATSNSERADEGLVNGLQTLRSSLLSAARSGENLGDVLKNVGSTVADELLGKLIDDLFIAPAAEAAEKYLGLLSDSGKVAADTAAAGAASARAGADLTAVTAVTALAASSLGAAAALSAMAAASAGAAAISGGGFFGAAFGGLGIGLRNGGPIPGFAGGGYLRGPGGPTDDAILAQLANGSFLRLSNEEYAVNARSTRKYRWLLDAINADRVPGFAAGGALNYSLPGQIRAVNGVATPRAASARAGSSFVLVDLKQTINLEGANGDETIRSIAYDAAARGFQATRAAVKSDLGQRAKNAIP